MQGRGYGVGKRRQSMPYGRCHISSRSWGIRGEAEWPWLYQDRVCMRFDLVIYTGGTQIYGYSGGWWDFHCLLPLSFSFRVYVHDGTQFHPPYHRVACSFFRKSSRVAPHASFVSLSGSSIPVNSKLFLRDLASRSINLTSCLLNRSSILHILTPISSIKSHASFSLLLTLLISSVKVSTTAILEHKKLSFSESEIVLTSYDAACAYGSPLLGSMDSEAPPVFIRFLFGTFSSIVSMLWRKYCASPLPRCLPAAMLWRHTNDTIWQGPRQNCRGCFPSSPCWN